VLHTAELPRDQRTVLVVEDDFLQREEIVQVLTREGLRVVTAHNGFAAMHQIRRAQPAVVVLDIGMPGLDGLDVARLIQRLDRQPRLILMSGFSQHIARAHRDDLGVFAIVDKPILFPALIRLVYEAVDQPNGAGATDDSYES
jgi:CheY-like chemotaxis protein